MSRNTPHSRLFLDESCELGASKIADPSSDEFEIRVLYSTVQVEKIETSIIDPATTSEPKADGCTIEMFIDAREHPDSSFLAFPAEIRNHIYLNVFTSGIIGSKNLGLLLSCKKIRDEASKMAWSNTAFSFASTDRIKLIQGLRALRKPAAHCITTFELPYTLMSNIQEKDMETVRMGIEMRRFSRRMKANYGPMPSLDVVNRQHPQAILERYLPNLTHVIDIAPSGDSEDRSSYDTRVAQFWEMVVSNKYAHISIKVPDNLVKDAACHIHESLCPWTTLPEPMANSLTYTRDGFFVLQHMENMRSPNVHVSVLASGSINRDLDSMWTRHYHGLPSQYTMPFSRFISMWPKIRYWLVAFLAGLALLLVLLFAAQKLETMGLC
ncbi:hypothetical protein EJ08DRAFT_675087 [Tothia fuscella]|uniref:Uncharacterized protein n=1 Tax=Tothia fuscella TaxID=1048955 RepID=A0A9P4P265_9PEZI|nr:hypothetical protein EJ08DRAFT_675087 [Tothia fuscella]